MKGITMFNFKQPLFYCFVSFCLEMPFGVQGKLLKHTAKRRCCSWRGIFVTIFLSVILLHVLGATRSGDTFFYIVVCKLDF